MSTRTKIALSFALFAPAALIILTGPSPSSLLQYLAGSGQGPWNQMGQRAFVFSMTADVLAWMTCLAACILMGRLAYRLRDRVPFALTAYILGLFVVCFGLQRLVGYALWVPMGMLGPHLPMVRAAASVVVAMGVAVLYPYVRAMISTVINANNVH